MIRTVMIILLLCALGCGGGARDVEVPSDVSTWESDDDFLGAVEKLDDDEKRQVLAFAARSLMAGVFGGEGIPEGTTIGEVLDLQEKWEDEQAGEAERREQLSVKLQAERLAALKKMNDALTVTLTRFQYREANYNAGRYSGDFVVTVGFQNNTERKIIGVKGVVVFKNVFGDELKRVMLATDQDIAPNSTGTYEGSLDYNQFMDEDNRLRTVDREKLKFEWEPVVYLFADGSKLEMPSGE